jgi:hypothetical protein
MLEEEICLEPIIEKPTLSDRIRRDQAARKRRKGVKDIKAVHQSKEEKDARERLLAKRRLEKQKRRKLKKTG